MLCWVEKCKCDILNLEWETNSRDTNIVEPVLCYLEWKYDLCVVRSNYENFLWKLIWHNPKMVIVSNYTGAPENTLLVRQAKSLGIKVISLISEGDVKNGKTSSQFFWGWNKKKEKLVDAFLLWSERSRRIFLDFVPESKQFPMTVCGATGFDRYKLLSFMDKRTFLYKYQRTQTRIIGIASWGFDQIESMKTHPFYSDEQLQYLKRTRIRIRDAYCNMICAHPDTLFVLKVHPGARNHIEATEFEGLSKLPNVLLLSLEESISDVINVSDYWIAFESTTTMEAWLLGKQTIFFNPTGGNFTHSKIVEGSPEIVDEKGLEITYKTFYQTGNIPGFDERAPQRKKLIEDIIQYADGQNHRRAAEKIWEVWNTPVRRRIKLRDSKKELIKELLHEIKFQIQRRTPLRNMPGTASAIKAFSCYDSIERESETKKYMQALQHFHKEEH